MTTMLIIIRWYTCVLHAVRIFRVSSQNEITKIWKKNDQLMLCEKRFTKVRRILKFPQAGNIYPVGNNNPEGLWENPIEFLKYPPVENSLFYLILIIFIYKYMHMYLTCQVRQQIQKWLTCYFVGHHKIIYSVFLKGFCTYTCKNVTPPLHWTISQTG